MRVREDTCPAGSGAGMLQFGAHLARRVSFDDATSEHGRGGSWGAGFGTANLCQAVRAREVSVGEKTDEKLPFWIFVGGKLQNEFRGERAGWGEALANSHFSLRRSLSGKNCISRPNKIFSTAKSFSSAFSYSHSLIWA